MVSNLEKIVKRRDESFGARKSADSRVLVSGRMAAIAVSEICDLCGPKPPFAALDIPAAFWQPPRSIKHPQATGCGHRLYPTTKQDQLKAGLVVCELRPLNRAFCNRFNVMANGVDDFLIQVLCI
jgi:hypothetical protein